MDYDLKLKKLKLKHQLIVKFYLIIQKKMNFCKKFMNRVDIKVWN